MMRSLSLKRLFCLAILVVAAVPALANENSSGARAPVSQTPDSFFQPQDNRDSLRNIPPVEGQTAGEDVSSFWDPVEADFFDSLPRALNSVGAPAEDFDERIWNEAFGEVQSSEGEEEWLQSKGYLEYRGTYSTNIDTSASGIDNDLRRRGHPTATESANTEVPDWINGFYGGYEHEFAIVPDKTKGAIRYDFAHKNYSTHTRENQTIHRLELAEITKLTETLEWEVFGGFAFDDRRANAQYFRADYLQWHLGTELRQQFEDGRLMTAGYQFSHRDYENLGGGGGGLAGPTEVSPFYDWSEHRFWTTYYQPLTEKLSLDLAMTYSKRDYESITLDEAGGRVPPEFRQYRLYEPLVALTATPTDHVRLTAFYRFKSLQSTGSFYDYSQNSVGLIYEQDLCPERIPGLTLISQFEYAKRDYDAQLTDETRGLAVGNQEVRDDELITLYVALERKVREDLTTGIDFTYSDNDSNDHSSEYQVEKYGAYVRYEF